eukprot:comp23480_c1_seq1/m.39259 comp23480_c1_seq1/g.39259  ORF comp23480_c1_seq1/g.39259 comp23480_c1_seq1/m.39259 type:complete len:313 (-) comp23480_c1_seq1:230-1168(-)
MAFLLRNYRYYTTREHEPEVDAEIPPGDEAKYFKGPSSKMNLYHQSWEPQGQAKGVVFVFHGYCEHSSAPNYVDGIVPQLTGLGLRVFAMDSQGHGRSGGVKGYFVSFQSLVDDWCAFIADRLKTQPADLPRYIVAHSLGTLMALGVVLADQSQWAGIVINGCPISIDPKVAGPFMRSMARTLASKAPKLTVPDKVDVNTVCRDKEVTERLKQDTLRYHGGIHANVGHEVLSYAENMQKRLNEITLPILITHGEADIVCIPEGSKIVHENVSSKDKTLKMFPDMWHETFCDPDKEKVYVVIREWLTARMPTA